MHLIHPTPMLAVNAFKFAISTATTEGKITMSALFLLSLFSWTIIITKARQLLIARKWAKKFFAAYSETRDPMDIKRKAEEFEGAPAYQLYIRGADEVDYHLKNNPVQVEARTQVTSDPRWIMATPTSSPAPAPPKSAWRPLTPSRSSWKRRRRRKP
jgi:hypothetical protein